MNSKFPGDWDARKPKKLLDYEILISDSAQCWLACSPTPRSVSHFWIFEKISTIFRKINKWIQIPLRLRCLKTKTNCLTPRSVSQFWIFENVFFWLRAVIANFGFSLKIRKSPRKRIFKRKHFNGCLLGAKMGWIHEIKKCKQISWQCHFKEKTHL